MKTTQQIDVRVRFEGVVTVNVPVCPLTVAHPEAAAILARKMALSRILATTDNPDAPDADAFDEFVEECESLDTGEEVQTYSLDRLWDESSTEGTAGMWTLPPSTEAEQRADLVLRVIRTVEQSVECLSNAYFGSELAYLVLVIMEGDGFVLWNLKDTEHDYYDTWKRMADAFEPGDPVWKFIQLEE